MTMPACSALWALDWRAPDAAHMLRFSKLLKDNTLGDALFYQVGEVLPNKGFRVNAGTIVGATRLGLQG